MHFSPALLAKRTNIRLMDLKKPNKKKRKNITISYEQPTTPPLHWKEIHDTIVEFRKTHKAPVDIFGSEAVSDISRDQVEPQVARLHTLVSVMLSSQTKDEVTAKAVDNLRAFGLTVPKLLETDESTIDELINKVGFHNRKAKYLKATAQVLHDKYNDDIPTTVEELMALPGVGPKMAHLVMLVAWDKPVGIAVDVHVHRIANRLEWVNQTSIPEKTRIALEGWLPEEYWRTINMTLVGFGQLICTPLQPKCSDCPVSQWCPSAFKESRTKRIKREDIEDTRVKLEDLDPI